MLWLHFVHSRGGDGAGQDPGYAAGDIIEARASKALSHSCCCCCCRLQLDDPLLLTICVAAATAADEQVSVAIASSFISQLLLLGPAASCWAPFVALHIPDSLLLPGSRAAALQQLLQVCSMAVCDLLRIGRMSKPCCALQTGPYLAVDVVRVLLLAASVSGWAYSACWPRVKPCEFLLCWKECKHHQKPSCLTISLPGF